MKITKFISQIFVIPEGGGLDIIEKYICNRLIGTLFNLDIQSTPVISEAGYNEIPAYSEI